MLFAPGICRINIPPVNMGAHSIRDFQGVGFPGSWKNFDIVSEGCETGITSIHMRFDGNADLNNSTLFALTPGGASGLGIEIQSRAGAIVVPNSITNLVNFTPLPAGGNYPMRARYKQTLPSIGTGPANGKMTVTMSYN
ncbi:MAG: hypothetical protein NVSMB28_23870 [Collimonas sp.]